MLFIMAKRRESNTIFSIINEIDPNAFVTQTNVIGVYGRSDSRQVQGQNKTHSHVWAHHSGSECHAQQIAEPGTTLLKFRSKYP